MWDEPPKAGPGVEMSKALPFAPSSRPGLFVVGQTRHYQDTSHSDLLFLLPRDESYKTHDYLLVASVTVGSVQDESTVSGQSLFQSLQ